MVAQKKVGPFNFPITGARTRSNKGTKAGYWWTIPISSELETLLKELKLEAGKREYVLPRLPGWEKCTQRHMRLAGIEVAGVTEILRLLPETQVMAQVVNLFQPERN